MKTRDGRLVVAIAVGGIFLLGVGYLYMGGLGDGTDFETDNQTDDGERYANLYEPGSPPEWVPEVELFLEDNLMYEVTRYPDREPTQEDLDAAWEMYSASYEAAEEQGFFDFETAVEDGYIEVDDIHYLNEEYYLNEENLNPYEPESLVYFETLDSEGDRKLLAGIMYHTDSIEAEGEQFGGPLTVWHYHTYSGDEEFCHASVLNTGTQLDGYECAEDDVTKPRGGEMIHVWFVEHPEGPFSTDMGSLIEPDEVADEYVGSKPPKMKEEEFKEYAMESYERYLMSESG